MIGIVIINMSASQIYALSLAYQTIRKIHSSKDKVSDVDGIDSCYCDGGALDNDCVEKFFKRENDEDEAR
jgi:hypothetical protein